MSGLEGHRSLQAVKRRSVPLHHLDGRDQERFYGRLPRKVVSRCCSGIGCVNLSGLLIEVFSPLAMMGIRAVQCLLR